MVTVRGSLDFSPPFTAADIHVRLDGWSLLGGSMLAKGDRLAQMSWKPIKSDKESLLETLPAAIDAAVEASW